MSYEFSEPFDILKAILEPVYFNVETVKSSDFVQSSLPGPRGVVRWLVEIQSVSGRLMFHIIERPLSALGALMMAVTFLFSIFYDVIKLFPCSLERKFRPFASSFPPGCAFDHSGTPENGCGFP
jgi:hypothetical protein